MLVMLVVYQSPTHIFLNPLPCLWVSYHIISDHSVGTTTQLHGYSTYIEFSYLWLVVTTEPYMHTPYTTSTSEDESASKSEKRNIPYSNRVVLTSNNPPR